jgi:hypothetical protein
MQLQSILIERPDSGVRYLGIRKNISPASTEKLCN